MAWYPNSTGWKTFDDNYVNISYIGSKWFLADYSYYYGGHEHKFEKSTTDHCQFNFTGTRIRIIQARDDTQPIVNIFIDGIKYVYYPYYDNGDRIYKQIVFTKTGLEDKEHTVQIYSQNYTSYDFEIDAIDIGDGKELKPYNPIVEVSYQKKITNIQQNTLTLIEKVVDCDNFIRIDLTNIIMIDEAKFEFYENDTLLFTFVLQEGTEEFNIINNGECDFYNFDNLKIKTDAITCKAIVYCEIQG